VPWAITSCVVALLIQAQPLLADPVAVIAAIKGKVEVASAGRGPARRVSFGRSLERGDRVAVGASSAATLFFNDGNVIELGEKSTLTVGGRMAGKSAAGTSSGLPTEIYASVSKFVAGGSRQTGLVALYELRSAPVGQDMPLLVAPRRTALLTNRPSFMWRAVSGATRYRVSVSSADGELWSREIEGLELLYPQDVPPLAPSSEYLWEVKALSDVETLRQEGSVFQVLSAQETEAVRANLQRIRESAGGPDRPAARFLAGSYLSGLGLYLDATEQFGALCKLSPQSSAPHEALGAVYTKVGLMDLAAAEFQQALALAGEP
jgi:hypothetical protein